MPLILSGDFNVNFAEPNSLPLVELMKTELNLTMNTNRTEATTKYGTTMDTIFSKF